MNSPSPRSADLAVVACGALSTDIAAIAQQQNWSIDIYPLPPLLHNRPERIAAEVDAAIDELEPRYEHIAIAYADCGTYGALDELCARRGLHRLAGAHCYDLYAGIERMHAEFEAEPGTYVLTDFLALSFERTVIAELGLDRHPELREDYFGNYTRVVWLAGRTQREITEPAARAAAARLGLPLEVIDVGLIPLTTALTEVWTRTTKRS